MGLLDDAIREHLDLKRRRGADPTEVARLEHEALGPVRREPAPAEEPAADAPLADAPAPRDEHPRPDDHTHVPPHGDPLFEQHAHNVELGGAAARAPEPPHAPAADEGEDDAPPVAEAPRDTPEPEPEPEPPEPSRADVVDQPTTEYRVEDHHDEQPEGEDVLEETPDFLQETPEHDRLWFEQRPPRDFDFDG